MARTTLSNAEQSAKTRTLLLNTALDLFAERGYAHTSTQDIVEHTHVTRGALYYHFRNKKGIFQAVFEQVMDMRLQKIQRRIEAAEGDTWHRFIETGCAAFIDNSSDTGTQRIAYLDGPSVLDSSVWHADVKTVAFIRRVLEILLAEGLIEDKVPCETLARLLWGAFLEAGITIALADDSAQAQQEMGRGLLYLFERLHVR